MKENLQISIGFVLIHSCTSSCLDTHNKMVVVEQRFDELEREMKTRTASINT